MRDEEYVFFQDVREKKVTGYSARKQRSHCGKAGCKLPSDYLTKKEIKNMSGECKSYRLNEPMALVEFRSMPDDIKVIYINAIREKYNAPNVAIAQMLGTNKDVLYRELKRLDLARGKQGARKWDAEGFFNWWKGIPTKEEPVEEVEEEPVEVPVVDEVIEEETPITEEVPCEPVQEETVVEIPNPGIKVNLINAAEEPTPAFAIPSTGSMTYEGDALDILRSISRLLGGAKVLLSVKWDVVED